MILGVIWSPGLSWRAPRAEGGAWRAVLEDVLEALGQTIVHFMVALYSSVALLGQVVVGLRTTHEGVEVPTHYHLPVPHTAPRDQ